jgi:hypothetical protein
MVAITSPCITLIDAIFIVLPIGLNNLNFSEGIELESLIADHICKIPLLHSLLIVIALQRLQLIMYGPIHLLESGVDLILECSRKARHVGVIKDVGLKIFEDDLELLH